MRKALAGEHGDRDGARPLERLRRNAILLTAAAAVVMAAETAVAQVPRDFGSSFRIGGLQALGLPTTRMSGPSDGSGSREEPMRKQSGPAGPHEEAIARYEFVQASLSWGALGSGYSSADKLVVLIVVRYASRQAARAAALQECAQRQLTECEIPIIASDACFSIVRNDDRSWFQAGADADKLTADLLRQCREEGSGSTCYVSELVCPDY